MNLSSTPSVPVSRRLHARSCTELTVAQRVCNVRMRLRSSQFSLTQSPRHTLSPLLRSLPQEKSKGPILGAQLMCAVHRAKKKIRISQNAYSTASFRLTSAVKRVFESPFLTGQASRKLCFSLCLERKRIFDIQYNIQEPFFANILIRFENFTFRTPLINPSDVYRIHVRDSASVLGK